MTEGTAGWKDGHFNWPSEKGPISDLVFVWCEGTSFIKTEENTFKGKAKRKALMEAKREVVGWLERANKGTVV